MASLERRNETFRVVFMHGGRKYGYSLGTGDKKTADQLVKGVETLLWELDQAYRQLPAGVGVVEYLRKGGKVDPTPMTQPEERVTLASLRERYLAVLQIGAVEPSTLYTIRIHLKHVAASLGDRFDVRGLSLIDLQSHIDRRHRKRVRGRPLSPATIRKEIATFRSCWNWGADAGLVSGAFPNRGLRFPKEDAKPPFQTWEQIERQVVRGGLDDREQRVLWNCLFLDTKRVAEFLGFVHMNSTQPFLYPMCCLAAHTGARRSELLRARVMDVDLDGGTVTLSEKKKSKVKRTTRRVPLSPFLTGVLKNWLATHPGGPWLFCQHPIVLRSRTRRTAPTQVTRDEAHDHFQRTIAGSKWQVLKGWHVLRHSFISNCAAAGVDQRLIDEWVSHQTEEQRKRYRHLFPDQQREAIRSVFGDA
jgi:integrase